VTGVSEGNQRSNGEKDARGFVAVELLAHPWMGFFLHQHSVLTHFLPIKSYTALN